MNSDHSFNTRSLIIEWCEKNLTASEEPLRNINHIWIECFSIVMFSVENASKIKTLQKQKMEKQNTKMNRCRNRKAGRNIRFLNFQFPIRDYFF